MNNYFKIENDKLVTPPRNFKNQDGSIIINFYLNEEKLIEKGYRQFTDEEIIAFNEEHNIIPETSEPDIRSMSFSKLKVKEKLVELEIWDTLKSSLTDDEYEDLLLAKDLAFDNPTFVKFYDQLKIQIPNIDDILIECSI